MNAALKIDPSRLPAPRLEPSKPVRIDIMSQGIRRRLENGNKIQTWEELHRNNAVTGKVIPTKQGKPTGPRVWTSDKVDTLKAMWSDGKHSGEIADALHLSQKAVRNMIYKLRREGQIDNRQENWTDEQINMLMRLYEAGETYPKIAQALNRTIGACSGKMLDLKSRGIYCGPVRGIGHPRNSSN